MFAYHLTKIGVLNGNSDSTGCVRGGREYYAIILLFFVYIFMVSLIQECLFPCRRHLALYLWGMESDLFLFYDCFL